MLAFDSKTYNFFASRRVVIKPSQPCCLHLGVSNFVANHAVQRQSSGIPRRHVTMRFYSRGNEIIDGFFFIFLRIIHQEASGRNLCPSTPLRNYNTYKSSSSGVQAESRNPHGTYDDRTTPSRVKNLAS